MAVDTLSTPHTFSWRPPFLASTPSPCLALNHLSLKWSQMASARSTHFRRCRHIPGLSPLSKPWLQIKGLLSYPLEYTCIGNKDCIQKILILVFKLCNDIILKYASKWLLLDTPTATPTCRTDVTGRVRSPCDTVDRSPVVVEASHWAARSSNVKDYYLQDKQVQDIIFTYRYILKLSHH